MSNAYANLSAGDFPPPRCNEPRRFTSVGDDQSSWRVSELTAQKMLSLSLSAFVLSSGSVLSASRSPAVISAFPRTIRHDRPDEWRLAQNQTSGHWSNLEVPRCRFRSAVPAHLNQNGDRNW